MRFRRRAARSSTANPRSYARTVLRGGSGTVLAVADIATPLGDAVSRDVALSIPIVASCRNLIVGAAVQMGVFAYRGSERLEPGPLLSQPDPDTIWPATLGGTLDDLLFHGRAYWRVLAFDGAGSEQNPRGFPIRARWIPYADVSPNVRADSGAYQVLDSYTIAGERGDVDPREVIRFDSPSPGVLAVGGRAIANGVALEAAARRMADVELPAGVLQSDGTELGEEEATELIQTFQTARETNSVAYLQGVTYERTQISAEDLQLIQARDRVDTECARLFNVPVAMASASPTGNASALLYANLASQLAVFVSEAVAPHLRTIESTLSLPTVTPRGQSVAFDVQTYLRADPEAAAAYATQLYAADLISREEARAFLGIPSTVAAVDLTPGRV